MICRFQGHVCMHACVMKIGRVKVDSVPSVSEPISVSIISGWQDLAIYTCIYLFPNYAAGIWCILPSIAHWSSSHSQVVSYLYRSPYYFTLMLKDACSYCFFSLIFCWPCWFNYVGGWIPWMIDTISLLKL
jgi:hypothetical protein